MTDVDGTHGFIKADMERIARAKANARKAEELNEYVGQEISRAMNLFMAELHLLSSLAVLSLYGGLP